MWHVFSLVLLVGLMMPFPTPFRTPLAAHEGATGIVKERMDAMEKIGDATKALTKLVRSGRRGDHIDPRDSKRMIDMMAEQAALEPGYLFPKGSLGDPSDALPKIWGNWPKFEGQWNDMRLAIDSLKQVPALDKKGLTKGLIRLSKTCKACHDDFREEK